MTTVELTLLGSAVTALLLISLFAIEGRRGSRYMAGVRSWLDARVDSGIVLWHRAQLLIGSGAGRVGLHYLLHRILGWGVAGLEVARNRFEYWQRRNRRIARTVQAVRTETHLTAIAEHKHATALSEDEKTALKERSLEG
jgi:hypothetical protein